MIPDDVVDEVRARADIVEIIGEHVALKRAGKDFKARCPFHEERTPSFYVVPSKGFYKCFGCGESGDAFTFLLG
jgi:DNA primase